MSSYSSACQEQAEKSLTISDQQSKELPTYFLSLAL
jgi:hypothetical protein